MKPTDLESMSVDELWSLRALLIAVLTGKMSAKKRKSISNCGNSAWVQYLTIPRKSLMRGALIRRCFRNNSNPAKPSETWAGRGKQPRWLTAQLRAGKKLDDFRIQILPGRARPQYTIVVTRTA